VQWISTQKDTLGTSLAQRKQGMQKQVVGALTRSVQAVGSVLASIWGRTRCYIFPQIETRMAL
jgi:hypothetical protein